MFLIQNLIKLIVLSKYLLSFFFFFFAVSGLKAQILNDSVRNVYGPKTTLYLYENSIKYNKAEVQPIDTTLNEFHNFSFVDRLQRKYQDLGILGTPMRPVYYLSPVTIGRTSGFHSFDPYFVSPEQVKYYDTKSPYSKLYFVIGGNGRSLVDVEYSRNVNATWNVGAALQLISADKQFGTALRRGDRNADAAAYQFYSRYFTKDNKYQLLTNFSRLGTTIGELGGLKINPEDGIINRESAPWLSNARSREVRYNAHLYHQYKVSDIVQLYHSLDYTHQNVSFEVPIAGSASYFLANNLFKDVELKTYYHNKDTTKNQSLFKFLKNEIGLKGDLGPLFYNFYLKRRDLKYSNKYLFPQQTAENYAGFNLRNDFTDDMNFYASGEYLLGRNYRLESGFTFRYIEANIKRIRYDPSFLHERYSGNHLVWENNFSPVRADVLYGALHLELPFLKFSPHINLQRVNHQIYLNTQRKPEQAEGAAIIFSPGIDLNLRFFRNIYFENHFVYTGISGDADYAFRIPKIFLNSRLYYGNFLFKNKLQLQAGVDMHFRSSYFAYGYEPVIQQFFLQNEFAIPSYPLADVFVNFKISRARIFLKYTNVTFHALGEYYATPYYLGQQGAFDFGVSWLFFD